MQVTEVKLSLRDHEMVRAYVDITLDDCITIYGLRLFGTITVILVAIPQQRWRKGGYYTIVCRSTPEARRMIEDAVMAEYLKVLTNASSTVTIIGS